jgi:hypothetical protein
MVHLIGECESTRKRVVAQARGEPQERLFEPFWFQMNNTISSSASMNHDGHPIFSSNTFYHMIPILLLICFQLTAPKASV